MAVDKNIGEKPFYDMVFVVLVYRNVEVLKGFFASLPSSFTYKVIVVNSFYDSASESKCRSIAAENQADFLSLSNKGYGNGNNAGCQYAMTHYQFRYMVISNSDIVIQDLDCLRQMTHPKALYAPDIRMENGHRQNPHIPVRMRFYLWLFDLSYRYRCEALMSVAFAINRLFRELFVGWTKIFRRRMVKVFSAHGSFIILTSQALADLYPVFHEDMFLYNEELYLGHRCKQLQIPVYYVPRLKILHLEGASSTPSSNGWKNHEDSYRVLAAWMREHHYL